MYIANFIIPLNKDELTDSSGTDQYCVRNVVPVNALSSCLADCRDALKEDGADFIQQNFDTLFSFLIHFKDLDWNLIGRDWDLVAAGFSQLITNLTVLLEDVSNTDGGNENDKDEANKGCSSAMDSETRMHTLSTVRMLTYIYSQMLIHCEDRVAKKNLMVPPEAKKGRKKGKNAIGDIEDEEDQFDIDGKRQTILAHFYSILQLPLNRLWDPPVAEEEFINLIANCCYKILEDPTIANARLRHIRESIFQVLGILIKRFNHGLSCSLKIVQLLKIYEHTSSPLAQGVISFAGPALSCRSMVREVLREISETDPGEFSADASGTRAICHFLTELAVGLPSLMQSSISLILPILEFESYSMRICVLGVLTEIISQLLSGDDLDEAAKTSRDSFLDHIENHMHDVNAFVRSKVLQYWQRLCREKAIPLTRQHDVLERAVGRLSDKSNLVRKYSLQLVRAFLEGNPFAVKLGLKDMLSQLEIEKKTLADLMKKYGLQDKEPAGATEVPKKDEADLKAKELKAEWKKFEPKILEAIYNHLDNEADESADKEMIESALKLSLKMLYKQLISVLMEEKYDTVAHMLFAVKKKHPKAEEIKLSEDGSEEVELSDGEEKGESEKVISDEEDSPTKEKKRSKKLKKRMKYLGKLLRKIYLENPPGDDRKEEEAENSQEGSNTPKEGAKDTENIEPTQELDGQAMEKIQTQSALVQFLEDSVIFVRLVSEMALPRVCTMLGSCASSDVLEAIDFFTSAFLFGLSEAKIGVREMLPLVFSKDTSVKDAVVAAYAKLYLSPEGVASREQEEGGEENLEQELPQAGAKNNTRARAVQVVRNLTGLVIGANVCERDSIEELVREWVISEDIDGQCIKVLWERFSGALPGTSPNESRAAVVLLGMAAGAEVQTIWTNLDVMVKVGLKGERGQQETEEANSEDTFDSLLVSETCEALLRMAGTHKKKQNPLDPPLRLIPDHIIFTTLSDILLKGIWDFQDCYYQPMALLAIDVIYQMAEKPDTICGQLIKDICMGVKDKYMVSKAGEVVEGAKESQPLTQDTPNEAEKPKGIMGPPAPPPPPPNNSMQIPVHVLSHIMLVVGHVAFREFVYLDTQVFSELKRRNNVREKIQEKDQAGKKGKQKSKRSGGSANMSTKSTTLSVSASEKSRHEVSKSEDGEDDVIGAVADDAEAEFIRNVCEMELVSGSNMLSLLCPMVVMVCAKPKKYHDSSLRVSAVLALAKYMCVSSVICQKYIQLLVTIMERSPEPVIRANCIIALGDLCYRFPNITEPWSPNLYGRLRDVSDKVRQNTLMVLTHLIMNDMVKVKGQISDMALCILDPCQKIRGTSKLFFQELAQKGNSLYNVMTDIISRLSNPSLGVPEKSFQTILSFLIQLITKDRLVDSLVEKLCLRFQTTSSGAFMKNSPEIPKENPTTKTAVGDGMPEKAPVESEEVPTTQTEDKDNANEENVTEKSMTEEVKESNDVGKDAREEEEKRQWRDLAFCLSLLPYNSERAIRRLMSHLPCYADKITKEPQVYSSFMSIVETAKKAAKAEMKVVIDEFQQKIEECIKTADEEGNVPDVLKKITQTPAKRGTNAVPRSVTKSARPRRKLVASSSSESDFESSTESKAKKPQSAVKSVQKRRGRAKKPSDSEEEDVQPAARPKRNPRRKVIYESGSEKENNQKSSEEDATPSPEPKKPKRGAKAVPRSAKKSARNNS